MHKLQKFRKLAAVLLVILSLSIPHAVQAQSGSSLTLADLKNLVHALKVVEYNEPSTPYNTMQCMVGGLLVQKVIRRLVDDGVTNTPEIQEHARSQWPKVEVKTGMTWMALCQGGNLRAESNLSLADLQNLIHALQVVEYTKASKPTNTPACALTGLLAQQVIRRIVEEGVTTDPEIQEHARSQWPKVEVKTGMTWMALCQGGNIK